MVGRILFVLIFLLSFSAQAQSVCGFYENIKSKLKSEYKETVREVGVTSHGDTVELFQSESGSWTLVLHLKTGMACLMGAGEGWVRVPFIPPSEKI